jgi:site-specific DNA-methyltransferase (adenine-specific)
MDPVIVVGGARVFAGDCREALKHLPDNSVDSVVTDPPYELGFMGKSWDSSGIAYDGAVWAECLRVLKPGGHILAFGGSRTWHRLAVAVEDAGFELRDSIAWIYGSGFPKSMNVAAGIEAKITTGSANKTMFKTLNGERLKRTDGNSFQKANADHGNRPTDYSKTASETRLGKLAPTTPEAEQWQGWGTALKPAFEPVVVGRKPFGKGVTVAENVLAWGVGGLNIDGSRIGTGTGETRTVSYPDIRGDNYQQGKEAYSERGTVERVVKDQGRWPANVIFDEVTAGLLDEQSGVSRSGKPGVERIATSWNANTYGVGIGKVSGQQRGDFGDTGGASRFFYVAKASKRDRNEGLEELEARVGENGNKWTDQDYRRGDEAPMTARKNFHPTVKPTALMRYLIKLVTPEGGVVLDPFTGSGSTGKAALLDGFQFVGVELTEEYLPIIEGRLRWASEQVEDDETLF